MLRGPFALHPVPATVAGEMIQVEVGRLKHPLNISAAIEEHMRPVLAPFFENDVVHLGDLADRRITDSSMSARIGRLWRGRRRTPPASGEDGDARDGDDRADVVH